MGSGTGAGGHPPPSDVDPFAAVEALPATAMADVMVQEVHDVPVAQTIEVNRDTVLRAAQIIQGVLNEQGAAITQTLPELRVRPAAEDAVSRQAAQAWNARLVDGPESYAAQVGAYLDGLSQLVANLLGTARQYGYSEDQIAAAMNAVDSH